MSDIFGGPPDDPFGFPEDYGEVEDPYGFFGGDVPDPWWGEPITLYDDFGEMHTLTAQEWYSATMEDPGLIEDLYTMEALDIIHQLEDYGLWDSDDWEIWREHYGESA